MVSMDLNNTTKGTVLFMKSVIKELYHGNLGFDSWTYGKDSPFVKAAQKKADNMKALMESFDNSQKELFEGYIDAQGDIEAITRYDTFVEALRFGILLMIEVYANDGDCE